MNAVIVSLGNLHTSMLGCYGGPWLETPALDSFATNGFVFDQCYVECPSPATTRRNWWTGRLQHHAPRVSTESAGATSNLITILRAGGVRTVLITDTVGLVDRAQEDAGFDEVIEIARAGQGATQDVFDATMRWLSHYSSRTPFLLFTDCYGAHQPIQLESGGADDEQDDEQNDEQEDPFVAAVSQLDERCGRFLEWLQSQPCWDQSLVGFTSDMGRVAECCVSDRVLPPDLSEWRTHVPLILRVPNTESAGRSSALVQPVDLIPTVFEAIGMPHPHSIDGVSLLPICRGERKSVRAFARLSIPGGSRAIRTSYWYLVEPHPSAPADAADPQLFAKPDDRWDRDDVSKRYPETVAELSQLLHNQTIVSDQTLSQT